MPADGEAAGLLGGPPPLFGDAATGLDLDEVDAPVRFQRQPRPLPAEQRVAYRLAVLTLTLSRFRQSTASIQHLHLLGWATRTRRSRAMLLGWWDGRRFADTVTERLDPNLNVTLNLALVHGLVRVHGAQGKRVALTEQGAGLVNRVDADEKLLRTEKSFLEGLGQLSDARIASVLGRVAS
jgi:hypothetical protein